MTAVRLVCEHLTRRHAGASRPALQDVSLEADPGRILVLLGESGAGKSTLLRVVAGLEPATAGRVLLRDADDAERVLSDPGVRVPPWRRDVGLVFQHLELWPHLDVAENIAFGLPGRPRGRRAARHERVRALAERVGIEGLLDRAPGTLSGGERQRVAIARTLAPSPRVLLYDEPLANLDPSRRTALRALIRSLATDGDTSVVHVTHDAEEAMALGDEIAVLEAGRLLERGTADELYHRPRTLAGARALGTINPLPARVEGGRATTPLGNVAVAGGAGPQGDVLALVRPDALRPGPGRAARIEETHPRGPDWSFAATVDGLRIVGRSERPLQEGETLEVGLHGPVHVIETPEVA